MYSAQETVKVRKTIQSKFRDSKPKNFKNKDNKPRRDKPNHKRWF